MKDFIIKELFWFIIIFMISLVLSFLFLGMLSLNSSDPSLNEVEKVFTVQLYIVGCIVSMLCVYVIRIVVAAIKKYI
jgi:uncharacterized membrane protein|tara:strand:+ start:455 stop:685 length:231 start_codon:yes stop_codon:yes gene_type:complete